MVCPHGILLYWKCLLLQDLTTVRVAGERPAASSQTNMVGNASTTSQHLFIHSCIHAEETVGMGTCHDVSRCVRLLILESVLVFAAYRLFSHGSLEGLEINEPISYFDGYGGGEGYI